MKNWRPKITPQKPYQSDDESLSAKFEIFRNAAERKKKINQESARGGDL